MDRAVKRVMTATTASNRAGMQQKSALHCGTARDADRGDPPVLGR